MKKRCPTHCRARSLLVAACLSVLSACTGTLLPKPSAPPARYTLDDGAWALTPEAAVATATAYTVTVDAPRAAAGHDSRRMVYLRHPQELEAFAFHEWVDTPSQMLKPLLVRALQTGGAFRVVLAAPSAAASAWRLETELLRLQQDFTVRPSQVRLSMRVVILDTATRHAVAWRHVDVSVAATSDDPTGGIAAAQKAAQSAVAVVALFCAEQARLRVSPTP